MPSQKQSIQFDMNTDKLLQCGFKVGKNDSVKDKLEPYNQIAEVLKPLGFKRHQKSVYISVEPITQSQIRQTIKILDQELPWYHKCVNKVSSFVVPTVHDLKSFLEDTAASREASEIPEPVKDDIPAKV